MASHELEPSVPQTSKVKPGNLVGLPLAVLLAFAIHRFAAVKEPPTETRYYDNFLFAALGVGIALALLQLFCGPVRRWLEEKWPILAATLLAFGVAELATSKFRLLPLPYFPSPPKVLFSIIDDGARLWDGTWHSLILLFSGYTLGVLIGLVCGVCIGWFRSARYWGMPVLKVLGPIPATAWIPLALVISPSAMFSAIGLIALAVWFPVTMLTSSGIANTRTSFLDVAKTLGAGRSFLIFRVAVPAALPNIFIGLFMGLGSAFLTLVVAETVGVKSGLGWYLGWAKEWAEYGKVYAALVVMALFFSTIMSALFFTRDRILAWQKGVIKW